MRTQLVSNLRYYLNASKNVSSKRDISARWEHVCRTLKGYRMIFGLDS